MSSPHTWISLTPPHPRTSLCSPQPTCATEPRGFGSLPSSEATAISASLIQLFKKRNPADFFNELKKLITGLGSVAAIFRNP